MVVTPMKEKVRYDPYAIAEILSAKKLSSRRIEELSDHRISKSWVCGLKRHCYTYAVKDKLLILSEVLGVTLEDLTCVKVPGHRGPLPLEREIRRFIYGR